MHSHGAFAFLNFCEGIERDTSLSYLDPLVECLLKFNPAGDRHCVQEEVITMLAVVGDASEVTFVKVSRYVERSSHILGI